MAHSSSLYLLHYIMYTVNDIMQYNCVHQWKWLPVVTEVIMGARNSI